MLLKDISIVSHSVELRVHSERINKQKLNGNNGGNANNYKASLGQMIEEEFKEAL